MKNKLLPGCFAWLALTGLILGTSPGFAQTATNITVQSLSQIQSLTASPPANYGTPDPATFADKPFTVKSGTEAELFGGTPSAQAGDTVLLVLSATSTDVASDTIVGNAANSGAEGATRAPEPSPLALFGVATVGLLGVMLVRHRRHHCTSG